MAYETLLYEIDGPVLSVTLNRPDKLNAYTAVMGAELADAFIRADQDDDVRVVVVTGAGRGFCAGADISGGANAFDEGAEGSVAFSAPGQARQMLWRFSGDADPTAALAVDGRLAMVLGSGPDVKEGVAAFLEKRPPRFPGRVSQDMPGLYPWWE